MNKILVTIIILTLLVFGVYKFINYIRHIEINTVDPQISVSIEKSKKEDLLKQVYILDTLTSLKKINIKQAWIEEVWKNSFKDDNLYKEKLGGIQLVINTSDFQIFGYKENTFLNEWNIQIDKQQLQGSGRANGMYIFYLKDSIPPNRIKVTVVQKLKNNNNSQEIIFDLKKEIKATH